MAPLRGRRLRQDDAFVGGEGGSVRKTIGTLVLTAVAGFGLVTAPAGAAAGIDHSTTLGIRTSAPPGTQIYVSTHCNSGEDADGTSYLRVLTAQLVVGAPGHEQLAAVQSQGADGEAELTIPDWVDDAQPAEVRSQCFTTVSTGEEITEELDPATFDITPGTGPSVETRSFSRTTLSVGQAFTVASDGCDLPSAEFAGVDLVRGSDLSGSNTDVVASGESDVTGTSFTVDTLVADDEAVVFTADDGSVHVEEQPGDLRPGTYTAFPYCGSDSTGRVLSFEPQLIHVTNTAPVGSVDLTVGPGPRQVTFAGSGCTEGPVTIELLSFNAHDLAAPSDESTTDAPPGTDPVLGPDPTSNDPAVGSEQLMADASAAADQEASAAPAAPPTFDPDGFLVAQLQPAADGSWSGTAAVPSDSVAVVGYAACGDPLAEGFVYAAQVVNLLAATAAAQPPTTGSTSPVGSVAQARPATALPGTAHFTG